MTRIRRSKDPFPLLVNCHRERDAGCSFYTERTVVRPLDMTVIKIHCPDRPDPFPSGQNMVLWARDSRVAALSHG